MKTKTHHLYHAGLPLSIYIVFIFTVISNIVATFIVIKYFL